MVHYSFVADGQCGGGGGYSVQRNAAISNEQNTSENGDDNTEHGDAHCA